MDLLLKRLLKQMDWDKSLTFQFRLYRMMVLLTSVLCLFVVLPVNLLLPSLPLAVNLADITLGCFALFCYRESRRGRNHMGLFLTVLVALLNPIWFLNGGLEGSITYYFFPVAVLPMVFWRGRIRWVVAGLILLDLCGLMVLSHFFPGWTTPFQSSQDQLLDLLTGAFCSIIAIALVTWAVTNNYDQERELQTRYARELAASEENYRGVVENAMSIILRIDAAGKITFINKFAEGLFGYERAAIIGRSLLGSILPECASSGANQTAAFAQFLSQPAQHTAFENETVCRDGRRLWVTWTNQPIYDDQGRLREILCVGADITARTALLEQLRLTQTTMDVAAEQIVWTDEQGRIIYCNAAAAEQSGYPAEELLRLTLHDLAADFPASAWVGRWEALKRDRSARFEVAQRCKDGTTRPSEFSVTYLKVAAKEFTTVFIHDLTSRRVAEEKRRRHELELLQLQRLESLGVLAGGIAHDFNNLLTGILANLTLVKIDLPPESPHHELLDEAEKASWLARDLTTQLLTFAKGGQPVKKVIQLDQVLRDSISFALRGRPVKSESFVEPDLLPVEADAAQLSQVFNNLILNACEAMPEGGNLVIRARNLAQGEADQPSLPPGNYVEVSVRDRGRGIPKEILARIFDPYFTTKKSGTGLGLAVVHSIIKHHGGSVSVASTPGVGTVFTLLLPAVVKAEANAAAAPHPKPPGSARILVMDDEEMVRKAMTRALGRFGYEVETATDGVAAVESYRQAAAAQRPFQLVIMDLTIPGGMGGQEAIQRLLEFDPRAKAIVSSGYSDNPVMADCTAHGFHGVVAKPYTIGEVLTVIQKVLAS